MERGGSDGPPLSFVDDVVRRRSSSPDSIVEFEEVPQLISFAVTRVGHGP
jgi:hypothetical protein